jgi:hypothetical protein
MSENRNPTFPWTWRSLMGMAQTILIFNEEAFQVSLLSLCQNGGALNCSKNVRFSEYTIRFSPKSHIAACLLRFMSFVFVK